jgi:hypothetical protein
MRCINEPPIRAPAEKATSRINTLLKIESEIARVIIPINEIILTRTALATIKSKTMVVE